MTSGTTYGAEVKAREHAMRLARNAAFYVKHAHSSKAQQEFRKIARERVREARAANRRAVARLREMSADHQFMRDWVHSLRYSKGPAAY